MDSLTRSRLSKLSTVIARIKINLIKYFFFGNSITDDGYLRLAYLLGRFLVFLPLSLCATLVLGVYSLFRPVKIFMLRCERSKISFIVEDLEVALRIEAHNTKISGAKPALLFAVLDCDSPNRAFTAMYGRVLPFLDDDRPFFRGIIRYTLPYLGITRSYLPNKQQDRYTISATQNPVTSFTKSETEIGTNLENQILEIAKKEFVCIGLPDKSYYEMKSLKEQPVRDIELMSAGFPLWQNYLPCTQILANAGYEVLRMGQRVERQITELQNTEIIDYAGKFRSEFGDIWLLANCKFVISGGGTGLYWISTAFNVPVLITDKYEIVNTTYNPEDMFVPMLAWSRSEKRLMPFSWMIAQGEGWGHQRFLIEGDIEIIKNTAEEISEVVLEMDDRLNGTWIEMEEDVELQTRFNKLRGAIPRHRFHDRTKIGAAFLRRYQHLL